MNLKLKLSSDQILATAKILEMVYESYPTTNPQEKLTKSISFDLSDKFTSKQRKICKSDDIFDSKKEFGIALKYHEAFTLYLVIQHFLPSVPKEEKRYFDLLNLSNYLHQKLI